MTIELNGFMSNNECKNTYVNISGYQPGQLLDAPFKGKCMYLPIRKSITPVLHSPSKVPVRYQVDGVFRGANAL